MRASPRKPFTGRHFAAILVAGFAVVMCVNFYMASRAVAGFHGTVVDNSYVASQRFNEWLDKAETARGLGWSAEAMREDTGHVLVTASGVPEGAVVSAELRRPIGKREYANLDFEALGEGRFRSSETVKEGRWTMRLFIDADGQQLAQEGELSR
jgi:nitrogen fixation protein FixH